MSQAQAQVKQDTELELRAQLAQALKEKDESKAALEQMKAQRRTRYNMKATPKGTAALCGVRQFPLAFYAEEWEVIFECEQMVRDFIQAHREDGTLSFRDKANGKTNGS